MEVTINMDMNPIGTYITKVDEQEEASYKHASRKTRKESGRFLEVHRIETRKESFARPESRYVCIDEILSNDLLPWNEFSKCFPSWINVTARFLGNTFQKIMYLCYALAILFSLYSNYVRVVTSYTKSYQKSNCSKYYDFSFENFTHTIIYTARQPPENDTKLCDNSPLYFFGGSGTEIIRVLMCVLWLYSIDTRYGILMWKNQLFVSKMREKTRCLQWMLIAPMVLANLLVALVLTYIIIPTIVILSIFRWVFGIHAIQKILGSIFKNSEITFFYVFLSIQDACLIPISCVLNIIRASQSFHDDDLSYVRTLNCLVHCHLLIYRIIHIIIARKRVRVFTNLLNLSLIHI